jgi:hypothetical protein
VNNYFINIFLLFKIFRIFINITKQLFVDTFNINLPYVEETQNLNVVNFLRNNFNHQNVKYILDNTYNNIEIVLYENINHYDKYIYPIFFYTSDFHLKYDDIIIPDRILNLVHSGRCKILFMQHMEGNFGMDLSIYEWFHKLSKKYKKHFEDIKKTNSYYARIIRIL